MRCTTVVLMIARIRHPQNRKGHDRGHDIGKGIAHDCVCNNGGYETDRESGVGPFLHGTGHWRHESNGPNHLGNAELYPEVIGKSEPLEAIGGSLRNEVQDRGGHHK